MDEGSIMTTNDTGRKTKKRGLQTLKASFVPFKRPRKLHFLFDDSSNTFGDDGSSGILPRSLYFLLYLVGRRVANGSSSGPLHFPFHCVPSNFSHSATKMEPTLNLQDLIQQFNFQVNRDSQVVANDAGSGRMKSRQIAHWLINGPIANTCNTQSIHEAFCDLLSLIKMDDTVQDEIVQSNNLTCWLKYLHHPDGNVSCFVMDMLRYLAGSSNHLRQRMGSNVELIFGILCILKENVLDRCKQQLGLSILSWVVEVETCRELLIREGCAEHLFDVMDIYPWDDVVQCNATATLCWLLHTSPSSSTSIASTTSVSEQDPACSRLDPIHCVMILMNTMRRFLVDAKVFGNTLSALSAVLLKHAPSLESHHYPSVDIVRLTLFGMRFHRVGRPKVQSNGLTLLRILLAHDNGDEEDAVEGDSVIGTVVRNIDIVQECMKQYSDDSFIQAEACGILAYLVSSSSSSSSNTSTTKNGRSRILQSGCIETVVQAQMKHRGDIRLQHYALWFHSGLLRDQSSPGASAFGAGLSVLDTMAAGRIVPIATAEH